MDDSTENDNDGLRCDQPQHEPQVPSVILVDPSSAPDPPPTPESMSLAAQPTPTQEEVEEAWPAPSNDNMNAADTWGFGIVAAPDINPGDTWGSNNEATSADTVADTWGTEAKGVNANTNWKDGGGWKSDRGESNDRGYDKGGFRRDRPFWQPPERDGGWEGFRKRGGFKGGRRGYPDSGGGHHDNGSWKSPNNDKGYTTNATDSTGVDPTWVGANYSTKNDTTWDGPRAKDVEAAWGLATEDKIEKTKPEAKKGWDPPQEGSGWDAPPPLAGANPYRPAGKPKRSDGLLNPSTTAGDSAPWTVEGNASWGTGERMKKVLDSKQTEGMIRRVLGERARNDTPRPPQVEEPPDEEDAGDEEGDITPPPTSPIPSRRSVPYSYVSSRSRRAGSPTLTTTTLDTGTISAGTMTTTGRGVARIAMSEIPPARRVSTRAGSVVGKSGGRIVYEDALDDDEEDYEYIYQETRPPLVRGREVIVRDSMPTRQRTVYQQAHPQYVYVYEGEEEYEDGELYYAPAPPQDSHAVVRRPTQPKSMSFRVPNTHTDVTITVKEAAPPPVRYSLARPRPVERVVYVSEPAGRVRATAPRIYEVDDDGYTIAEGDEYDDVPIIAKPIPKRRAYIRE